MFIPPIFSFFRNSQILIPQHFPPSIKFSNLPIKSFHYKSHHPLSADFVFVVFTLRIIQLGNSALQNRGDPVTVEFFRMEQWMVAQKGWRYIYIYIGRKDLRGKRVSDSSPVISGQSKTRFRSIVVDTAFHAAALSSHWRKRYSTWYNARRTRRVWPALIVKTVRFARNKAYRSSRIFIRIDG